MHLKICQIELRWPDWTLLRLMSSALPTAVIGPGSQNENAINTAAIHKRTQQATFKHGNGNILEREKRMRVLEVHDLRLFSFQASPRLKTPSTHASQSIQL